MSRSQRVRRDESRHAHAVPFQPTLTPPATLCSSLNMKQSYLALLLIGLVAFASVAEASGKAKASHILVKTEAEAEDLKSKIASGETTFADAAKAHSSCPSGKRGGDLGQFGRGQMVKEFDSVVFNEEVGVVHGPVKTQFGYHLILITERA
mmetsp:Transcript_29174/g.93190  ORF Transcript_29174/g.93190 Transcript_29174/m.93190 type:complete len:151 (+) Transcript_29174:540-992(+)